MRFRPRLPGYEVLDVEFMTGPLTEPLPRFEIELRGSNEIWSDLELAFVGHGHDPEREGCPGLPRMYLSVLDETWRPDRYPIVGRCDEPVEITNIPAGTYALRIEFENRAHTWPRTDQDPLRLVVDGAPARLEVDLSQECTLDLSISTTSGEPYLGLVRGLISPGRPQTKANGRRVYAGVQDIREGEPPFRVEGLVPGLHTVQIHSPRCRTANGAAGEDIELELQAGRPNRVELTLVD